MSDGANSIEAEAAECVRELDRQQMRADIETLERDVTALRELIGDLTDEVTEMVDITTRLVDEGETESRQLPADTRRMYQ